jgi:predicted Zn-dependent protease with MMP-like domain
MKDAEEVAEELYQALEEGDGARAGELGASLLRSRDPEHRILAATGLIEGGEPERAVGVLEALSEDTLDLEQRELRTLRLAECWYALGDPERALALLEAVPIRDAQDEAERRWWIGLCHDHLGDRVQADLSFREASRLDPVGIPPPTHISPDEAAALVADVIARLPPRVRGAIDEIPVVIDDLPPLAVVRSSAGEIHPDTLGLYTGQDLAARSSLDPAGLPSMIHIFRRNLERFALDRSELDEEIRVTLLHELGHHLGLDEDDVDALGLG